MSAKKKVSLDKFISGNPEPVEIEHIENGQVWVERRPLSEAEQAALAELALFFLLENSIKAQHPEV